MRRNNVFFSIVAVVSDGWPGPGSRPQPGSRIALHHCVSGLQDGSAAASEAAVCVRERERGIPFDAGAALSLYISPMKPSVL